MKVNYNDEIHMISGILCNATSGFGIIHTYNNINEPDTPDDTKSNLKKKKQKK